MYIIAKRVIYLTFFEILFFGRENPKLGRDQFQATLQVYFKCSCQLKFDLIHTHISWMIMILNLFDCTVSFGLSFSSTISWHPEHGQWCSCHERSYSNFLENLFFGNKMYPSNSKWSFFLGTEKKYSVRQAEKTLRIHDYLASVKPSETKWNRVTPKWNQVKPSDTKWHQVKPSDTKWTKVTLMSKRFKVDFTGHEMTSKLTLKDKMVWVRPLSSWLKKRCHARTSSLCQLSLAHNMTKQEQKRSRPCPNISIGRLLSCSPTPIEITLSHRKTFLMLVGLSPTVLRFFKQEIAIGDCSRIVSSTFVGA